MKRNIKKGIAFLFFMGCMGSIQGQVNMLYHNHNVPQSIHLNPAVALNCKSFIELPVISSIYAGYHNNLFSYNQILGRRPLTEGGDYINFNNLIENASRNNRIAVSSSITLLGGGLELERFYVSGRIAFNMFVTPGLPADVFKATDGNWDLDSDTPRDFNFGNSYLTLQSFTEFSVAVSGYYTENLRIGGRVKYLQGAANIHTRNANITLDTDDNPLTLNAESNVDLRTSMPMQLTVNNEGYISDINFESTFANPFGDYFLNKNRGIAVDAGLTYDYSDKLQVSASVINLGFIRWKSNTHTMVQEGNFTFDGIDLNQINSGTTDQDVISALEDSLRTRFSATQGSGTYFTMLPLQIFGGGTYQFNDRFEGAITTRTDVHNGNFFPSATFSLGYKPFSALKFQAGYSLMNKSYNNIGGGVIVNIRNLQFYFLTDMFPLRYARDVSSGILVPYNARTVNIHLGINLLFGCNQNKKYGRNTGKDYCPAYH